jgi:hypothetical protein
VRLLQTLRITLDDKGDFLPSAFTVMQVHHIDGGSHTSREVIMSYLDQIAKSIEQLKTNDLRVSEKPGNDLVLIYFQGSEFLTVGGHYLGAASQTEAEAARTGIPLDDLRTLLREMPGAPLLLLDIVSSQANSGRDRTPLVDRLVSWPWEARRLGVLRVRHGPGNLPAEASLLSVFERTTAQASRRREMVEAMAAEYKQLAQKYPAAQLRFDGYVPDSWLDILANLPPK